ncbi:MAG: RHS repeat protein [Ekhidna sp.]|nr:RHS repeat protein [Ekhidna sp.]
MKFLKVKTLFVLFLLTSVCSVGQVAPSPDAMGVASIQNGEDLYRGYVSEAIPLYSIAANNGRQVPIQLVYQTRGVKVNDVASSVGLGWNLAVGGAITRVMRDQPDDQSNFTESINSTIASSDQISGNKGYDFEKDIFYVNYPGGSAKFVSTSSQMNNNSSSFYGLPYNDLDITFFKTNNTNSYWQVIDTYGIKYIFGQNATAREITNSENYESGQSPKSNEDWTYISTWHLEKIVFPDLPDNADNTIRFFYTKDQTYTNRSRFSSKSYNLVEDSKLFITWRTDGGNQFTFLDPYYAGNNNYHPTVSFNFNPFGLTQGSWSSVVQAPSFPVAYHASNYNPFAPSTSCEDVGNCNSAFFAYSQGSFSSDFDFGPWITNPSEYQSSTVTYYKAEQSTDPEKDRISDVDISSSRLVRIASQKATIDFSWSSRSDLTTLKKVDAILVKDHLTRLVYNIEFEYDYFESGCASSSDCRRLKLNAIRKNGMKLADFQYTDELSSTYVLPERSSIKKDVYGYYSSGVNGKFGFTSFKMVKEKNTSSDPSQNTVPFYEYSGNDVQDLGTENRNPSLDAQAGSLWKVNYNTGAVKTFTYAAKSTGGIRVTNVLVDNGQGGIVVNKSYAHTNPKGMEPSLHSPFGFSSVTLFSDSPYLTYDHMSTGGYRKVVVTDNLNGMYTTYDFYTGSVTDISTKKKMSATWGSPDTLASNQGPMLPPTFSPYFGVPRDVVVRDAADKAVTSNYYKYIEGSTDFSYTEHAINRADNGEYFVAEVLNELKTFQLEYVLTRNYNDSGDQISEFRTDYEYHPIYKTLPTIVKKERSDPTTEGFNSKTYTYYPSDYDDIDVEMRLNNQYGGSALLDEMVSKQMIGYPLAIRTDVSLPEYQSTPNPYRTGNIDFTVYKKFSGRILPHKSFTYNFPKPYSYYGNGYLTEVIDNGPKLLSTSNYNGNGLLASHEGSDGIKTTYTYDSHGYISSKTVDPTPGVSGMEQTTIYTHKPLVGLETVTDPTGETITNVYDTQNRLYYIMDDDDNIVKRYRYNYGSEDNGMAADIRISGTSLTNNFLTFSAQNVNMYGTEADYKWRIEGTTYTGQSVDVAFADMGSKSVTLNIINPEYDEPFEDNTSISIFSNIVNPQIGGPNNYDACTHQQGTTVTFQLSALPLSGGATCYNGSGTGSSGEWFYKRGSGSYQSLGFSGTFPEGYLQVADTYTIKYVLTDECGNEYPATHTFTVTSNCGGPGGGITIE